MLRYILRRVLMAVVVLVSVSIVTFIIARIVPSDPAALYAGPRPTPEQIAIARDQLELDRPMHIQYVGFVGSLLRGDLGVSFRTKRMIAQDIAIVLPATLELVIVSWLFSLIVGIPAGVLASARPHRWFDLLSRLVALVGASMPTFWLALLLQLLFFRWLGWLPLSGRISNEVALFSPIRPISGFYLLDATITGNWAGWWDAAVHLVLPALVLATYPLGLTLRMTRTAMIDVLREPYILAARAQGLLETTILFRCALKNALMPTLTVLGLSFVYALTGAFAIEVVFAWPGLGHYLTDAILSVDFPIIVSVTLVVTLFYVSINLVVDVFHAVLDPRVVLG